MCACGSRMALDVTGSMRDDGKMPAMQTAAKSLIDQLSPLAKNPGDIYISIVPFAKDVNLGTSYYNQSWIDWSEMGNTNQLGTCSSGGYTTKSACQNASRTWTPANQQHLDRLRHRPHAGLRHQEHATELVQRADDGRCRGIRLRLRKILQDGQRPLYAADHAAELRLECAQDVDRDIAAHRQYQPGHWYGMGLAHARDGRTVQRACQGYRELHL